MFKFIASTVIVAILAVLAGKAAAFDLDRMTPEATEESCSIKIGVEGDGIVSVDQAGLESRELQSAAIAADCNELVRLFAKPKGPWKFEKWLGVDGAERLGPAISVSGPAEVTAVFSPRRVIYVAAEEPYYDRSGQLVDTIPVYEPIWQPLESAEALAEQTEAPEISAWYGDPQPYGVPGVAQQWYNVLGNVSDNDMDLSSLEYQLNGGDSVSMDFGGDGSVADGRRLWGAGDFVVDLDRRDLATGANSITITATDSEGNRSSAEITVNYAPGSIWPLPSNVVWDSVGTESSALLDVSQVVDGEWRIVEDGVRTKDTGYDRLLNVGDVGWSSYEALVPVTLHSYSSEGFGPIQFAPAIGLIMHWQGHTDNPIVCGQPKCGWLPVGMAAWYEWDRDQSGNARFKMWVNHNRKELAPSDLVLVPGTNYLWKVQANNSEGSDGVYRMKVWEAGTPEPTNWLMEKAGTAESQKQGSLLLLAHHVDVTFGDVKLRPLGGDFDAPVVSSIQFEAEPEEATVSWQTDEPATSRLTYYDTPGNEVVVADDALVTNHTVFLENLTPETTYAILIGAEDASGNAADFVADSFTTQPSPVMTYSLMVSVEGLGTVQVDPSKQVFDAGESVTLTAVPESPKWYFANWSMDVGGAANPLTLAIGKDTEIKAIFAQYALGDFSSFLPIATGP